jgi:hypothetical protein
LKTCVVRVGHVNTAITSADAIVESQSKKLGNQLSLRVLDQFGYLSTDIVNVILVVSIAIPTIVLPTSHRAARGPDNFFFRLLPSGLFPSGLFPSGLFPSGLFPSGPLGLWLRAA